MKSKTVRFTPLRRAPPRVALLAALLATVPVQAEAPGARPAGPPAPAPAPAPAASEILQAADRSRGGLANGITWEIQIDSVEDKQRSSRSALVKVLKDDSLVEMIAPAREKGRLILISGHDMWFTLPGLKKPILISSRTKLTGQAANGDIATTNYARDYQATLAGEDKVGAEDAWRLELKAIGKNVTYDRIRYWVSKERRLGLKAEFLTVQGEVFKKASFEYGNTLKVGSQELPFISRMVITDEEFPENVTTIAYSQPRLEEHPASLFNVSRFVR